MNFPRDLPAGIRFLEQPTFDLQDSVAINKAGGSIQAMELSSPVWVARYVTEPLAWRERKRARAWFNSFGGGLRTFYGYDPFAKWPSTYGPGVLALIRSGGGAFDGTAKVTANNVTKATIATLPNGYQFAEGDMIELPRDGGLISLHEVIEAIAANGAGIATDVLINPPAPADVTINSTAVRLVGARCLMVPKAGTFNAPGGLGQFSASFEAVQTYQ
jgi:hypothetical protein